MIVDVENDVYLGGVLCDKWEWVEFFCFLFVVKFVLFFCKCSGSGEVVGGLGLIL